MTMNWVEYSDHELGKVQGSQLIGVKYSDHELGKVVQ